MMSVGQAFGIAGVIVAVAFVGWGLAGVLWCFAICAPILIVTGFLNAIL